MKKTYYFQHDYNARNDPKLQALIIEMGVAGIGIYWCLVEMLYEQDGEMPMNSIKSIAYNLHVKQKTVERVIKDFGLFDYDDDKSENVEKSPKMFRNKSVLKRLNRIIDISEKRKRAIETRWKSKRNSESNVYKCNTNECENDTNEVQTEYKSNTPIIKEKEIKGNKIKEDIEVVVENAREKEIEQLQNYINEIKTDRSWQESVCMKYRINLTKLTQMFLSFAADCQIQGTVKHDNLDAVRYHFANWLRIQIEQENKKKNDANKNSKRRGYGVTATSAADYSERL